MAKTVDRQKTAMSRNDLSRPVKQALDDGMIRDGSSFFDYGCGRGDDVRHLRLIGYQADGWDPFHEPDSSKNPAKVVNLGYVINVIEDRFERAHVLREAWDLTEGVLIVSARLDWELAGFRGSPFNDGYLTADNTFQKFYSQDELRAWLESTLKLKPVAASPGVFYLFRDTAMRAELLARKTRTSAGSRSTADLIYLEHSEVLRELEDFVATHEALPSPIDISNSEELIDMFGSLRSAFRVVRQASTSHDWSKVDTGAPTQSEKRFEQELDTLEPLIDFIESRGRLPRSGETEFEEQIADTFGSLGRAFSLIRRVTGDVRWSEAADRARLNVLVYVALSNFEGRPKFTELSESLRYDIKDLIGSYKEACRQADYMLFELADQEHLSRVCAESQIGKLTPEALYVHTSALDRLHPLLRLYEGCARALTGTIQGHVVLKIHRLKPQISYLLYPNFDKKGHPEITASVVCRLSTLEVAYRDYRDSNNPHILHRKDLLVDESYPLFDKFERLTKQEQRAGLLGQTQIGTLKGWQECLRLAGFRVSGHTLKSTRSQ